MWQDVRDYWLPWMLFTASLLAAAVFVLLVSAAPQCPFAIPGIELFADDPVVRRSSIAAAIGLVVTAFVFFRPRTKKPSEPEA
ncbi:MAG: hypothetical protein HY289_01050 [Planctomycetes bacterium]|nr:hypothetical protein [Planctomycetota bacterium]